MNPELTPPVPGSTEEPVIESPHQAEVIDLAPPEAETILPTPAQPAGAGGVQLPAATPEATHPVEPASEEIAITPIPELENATLLEGMKILFHEKAALAPVQVVEITQEESNEAEEHVVH